MPKLDSSHADAWINDHGLRRRAVYQAESGDGQLIRMKFSGQAQFSCIRWFHRSEVEFVRPVTRVVVEPSRPVRERLERKFAPTQDGASAAADA